MKEFMKFRDELISLRRDFHMHPELGFKEYRTSRIVEEYLKDLGIKTRRIAGTGIVGDIDNGGNVRVAIRADMDALPIEEENKVPYKSRVKGVMHACGHDAHTAMLLIAAKILSHKDFDGKIRFIFQPAEEGLNGARRMVQEGAIDGVDYVIGMHVWSSLESKTIAISPGPVLAAVDRFEIEILGKGGHGAAPHLSVDPIVCASSIIMNLQTVVSRNVDPIKSAVLTVGEIHGGTAFNIIPERVRLSGTARSYDEEVHRLLEERLKDIVKHNSKSMGCKSRIKYEILNYATVNDEKLAKIGREVAKKITNVVDQERSMGGEDFSEYARIVPGLFAFLGTGNKEKGTMNPHHSPKFDIDEDALPYGVAFEVNMALELLSRKTSSKIG